MKKLVCGSNPTQRGSLTLATVKSLGTLGLSSYPLRAAEPSPPPPRKDLAGLSIARACELWEHEVRA
eukprot:653570-Lingulodinium_polyedra.AAC.1